MNRTVIIGGVAIVGALAATRPARTLRNVDWQKKLAALPDTAPPKWMFSNIQAIRQNTDRILELLQAERGQNPDDV